MTPAQLAQCRLAKGLHYLKNTLKTHNLYRYKLSCLSNISDFPFYDFSLKLTGYVKHQHISHRPILHALNSVYMETKSGPSVGNCAFVSTVSFRQTNQSAEHNEHEV
jgi:hypothetical protein